MSHSPAKKFEIYRRNIMKKLLILLVIIFCGLVSTSSQADEIRSGTYSSGDVDIIIDGSDVAVTVKMVGCIGELDGRLADNNAGEWFILGSSKPQCVLSLTPQGKFSFSIKQYENCSDYHGASCGFEGYFRRTN